MDNARIDIQIGWQVREKVLRQVRRKFDQQVWRQIDQQVWWQVGDRVWLKAKRQAMDDYDGIDI